MTRPDLVTLRAVAIAAVLFLFPVATAAQLSPGETADNGPSSPVEPPDSPVKAPSIADAGPVQGPVEPPEPPEEITETSALSRVVGILYDFLGVVLMLLGTYAAKKGVNAVEAWLKIDVPDKVERRIDDWIEDGIALAEEKARSATTNHTNKVTGPEKLELAADFVLDLAKDRGYIEWTRNKIKSKIEAKLNKKRA